MRSGRVLYFGIRDDTYPRNTRVRRHLESALGLEVVPVLASKEKSAIANFCANLIALVRARGPFDVVILSEFSLKYAPWTFLRARFSRARHVVDGFVGTYESEIDDRKNAVPGSRLARRARRIDSRAFRLADIYLIDTDVRGLEVRANNNGATQVITLPVGAPAWARPTKTLDTGIFNVLYYGNFIPLHGVEYAIDAISAMADNLQVHMTLVGDPENNQAIQSRIKNLRNDSRFTFRASVPELELAKIIADHDLVLGVFGSSTKASSVIANKVWQGLSSGRAVLTRKSPALEEIAGLVGEQLVTVEAASEVAIGNAIASLMIHGIPDSEDASERLEAYTQHRFESLGFALGVRPR